MSILNVNTIQPVGSGQTITVSAANITASSTVVTASSFVGSSGIQVGAGKSVRIFGSASGYSDLIAPAVAGDQTFTLPGTGGVLDRLNRAGNILQVVNTMTGAYATTTTLIPVDDTIPQNTEGAEFMSLSITPTSSTSKLLITVTALLSNSTNNNLVGALFQDSIANALTAKAVLQSGTVFSPVELEYFMTAGTTSSTTFKFRAGANLAGTTYFNGIGSRFFGGVMNSGITITEIAA